MSTLSSINPEPSNGAGTQRNHLGEALVADLVNARAQQVPGTLALVSGSRTLTYGELEAEANQLAHYLRSFGVGPDVLVGICLDRSPDMITLALGILKAGGAYVPLDPGYPAERLRFMLEDAGIKVLITRQKTGDSIGRGGWRVLDVEREAAQIARNPKTAPEGAVSGQNLAYVIYTSGSTGRPKGVQITHQSLLNLILWHQGAFAISASDRVSQVASVGFDAVVWEAWPNLAAGASLHFPDEDVRVAPEPLRDWLVAERITVSFVPTPLVPALLALDWPAQTALRFLLTGGDTLHHYPPSHLPFTLVNNYGPTECTVVATSGPVPPSPHADEPPPIGRPITNFQIYILDQNQRPVPTGTAGELHIAGRGLARGYLNRPELNAERFVANPFSQTPNDRMYKTGDLGRYLPDGQIAFVGRIDDQIKIRGYRIEPEEISNVLDQYPGIQASVVVARGESNDKHLIAYVVPAADVKLTDGALRAHSREHLPDYMVPATFVRLAALQMTANGKIDRASLPAPSADNTVGDEVRGQPSTPVEQRVVAILSELLGIEQVGMNDNFFFLGGHSLLGTQLIARARDSFGVELPLRTVFDSPTAAELSAVIEQMLRNEAMRAD